MSAWKSSVFVKNMMQKFQQTKTFERVLDKVKIVSCENGKCVAEFQVQEDNQNMQGALHGGFTAMLVDCISTYALMSSKREAAGVSVDMHIKYLKAGLPCDCVLVEANTVKAGRTLAFLDVTLSNKETGAIIATGSHTKFVGGQ